MVGALKPCSASAYYTRRAGGSSSSLRSTPCTRRSARPQTSWWCVKRRALAEWSNFLGRAPASCVDQLDEDVASPRRQHGSLEQRFNPRAVWHVYLHGAPVISHAAVAVLSAGGSGAAVERTFSAQGSYMPTAVTA